MVKAFHLHIIGNQLDIPRRLLLLTAAWSPADYIKSIYMRRFRIRCGLIVWH